MDTTLGSPGDPTCPFLSTQKTGQPTGCQPDGLLADSCGETCSGALGSDWVVDASKTLETVRPRLSGRRGLPLGYLSRVLTRPFLSPRVRGNRKPPRGGSSATAFDWRVLQLLAGHWGRIALHELRNPSRRSASLTMSVVAAAKRSTTSSVVRECQAGSCSRPPCTGCCMRPMSRRTGGASPAGRPLAAATTLRLLGGPSQGRQGAGAIGGTIGAD